MRNIFKYILSIVFLLNLSYSQDCEFGEPDWSYAPQDYEFSANLVLQVWLDGVEQTTGKLAAFVGDDIRSLDVDGALFFPPGGTNVYELTVWSNELSGETVTFAFYDEASGFVVDLDGTYDFVSGDTYWTDAFSPFHLTVTILDCGDPPCEDADADDICDDVDDCVGE